MRKIIPIIFIMFLLVSPMVLAKIDPTEKIDKKLDKIMSKVGYVNYKLQIHGTEYTPNEPAKLWIQLLDNYKPIENTTCFMTIYYPNNTIWINNSIMTPTYKGDGIQYYDFVTPEQFGVYMSSVSCNMPKLAFVDDLNDKANLYYWEGIEVTDGELTLDQVSKTGYAQTDNIKLEGYNWLKLHVDYNNYTYIYPDNYLNISLYSSNGTLLCDISQEDTDIKNCANTEPEIYLKFELGRDKVTDVSPAVFRYYVTWNTTEVTELRGSGEVHVTEEAKNITSICNPREIWKEFYVNPIRKIDLYWVYILLIIIIIEMVVIWKR